MDDHVANCSVTPERIIDFMELVQYVFLVEVLIFTHRVLPFFLKKKIRLPSVALTGAWVSSSSLEFWTCR